MFKSFLFLSLVVDLMGFSAWSSACAKEMTFRVVTLGPADNCEPRCAQAIVADGEIINATAQNFIDFLKDYASDGNAPTVVYINSPGGSVAGSLQLGHVFRAVRALVIVATIEVAAAEVMEPATGYCLSACVYAFMGGVKRILPSFSRLGVHRMSTVETGPDPTGDGTVRRLYDDGEIREKLIKYARSMGVSTEVIDYAESDTGDSLRLLSTKDVVRWKLAREKF